MSGSASWEYLVHEPCSIFLPSFLESIFATRLGRFVVMGTTTRAGVEVTAVAVILADKSVDIGVEPPLEPLDGAGHARAVLRTGSAAELECGRIRKKGSRMPLKKEGAGPGTPEP